MLWTAETVEQMKRLALEGRSAAAIAATLGVASRNAVIGKASRIGIKLTGGGRASARVETARARRAQWTGVPHPQLAGDERSPAAAVAPTREVAPQSEREASWRLGEVEVGEMRRLRFDEIRDSACRWPLGDPRSGEFAYCGLQPVEGHSYCAGHCRMAYRPPQARPGARERQGYRAIGNSWRVA